MNNPVAWQMWGPEALGLAKQHNKLLFVSIGYAACHWCHVMERESFMSPEIAAVLNSSFIPVKVDREERPDIDRIYMNFVQATTGSGGWPLNVFITPDLEPVFGGTYWPGPNSATVMGQDHVGFLDILEKVSDVWRDQEQRCLMSAKEITAQLRDFAQEGTLSGASRGGEDAGSGLEIELLEEAYRHFEGRFDTTHGGFAVAPKFPTPVNLSFLLRLSQYPGPVEDLVGEAECANATFMALETLRHMARGGIHDHVGNGFARYSVTRDWSLPHFEKMLYDQAQLLNIYLDAFLISQDPEMLGAVYDISTYLTEHPLASPTGGFFSAEDADSLPRAGDSEKREGAFYVWTLKEFQSILGERDAEVCARFFGVSAHGNVSPEHDAHDEFIDQNVLSVKSTPALLSKEFGLGEEEVIRIIKESRQKLREYRERERPRPNLDDKIVVAWNGLAIGALARVSSIVNGVDVEKSRVCREAAEKAVAFIRSQLYDETTGRLRRVYREGPGDAPGFADDYTFLISGLIDLYQATFNDAYLELADRLQQTQIDLFWDTSSYGFFSTEASAPDLILRLKDGMDSAEPSTNGISALNLHRLGSLLNDERYATFAQQTTQAFEPEIMQHPFLFSSMLSAVVASNLGMRSIVLTGGVDGLPRDQQPANIRAALEKFRTSIGPTTTVARIANTATATTPKTTTSSSSSSSLIQSSWLVKRNSLLASLDSTVARVQICEAGVCKEELDMDDLQAALP
ncbi:hypothetical protein L228DRAFT_222736 [Xylona heveae TC161]|uniref:Spermatogenesis-associated protein 20-like TRX domain-containing protein n=1 Tax=Xylona heveae (strain CBS 132557 / TC161) TaxID=1328760 RepID=A0A165AKG5_XYLHT|nr:hypothetical protein L228DRAFT_222736 [Xylona heveae TC161]KZF20633.1 hypothetical protein L228DRAFT_222736 [Xylona heveae TC161]